nr:hypothetical protein [Ruminococcus difficilis]
MNARTSPLLNGSENSEVITPHTAKNTMSEISTWIFPARNTIRAARITSYSTPSAAPSTSDHKK